jgi:acyl-CoA synthetase (AMP-forming)/AMP-acid ligase II
VLSHTNLLDNVELFHRALDTAPGMSGVSWLPPYHDMGLIGNILQAVYAGGHLVMMSPVAFLQRPFRWLQAMSRYRAAISGAPNFAYDLCVRKTTPEERATLHLRGWRVALCAAEPIRHDTLEPTPRTENVDRHCTGRGRFMVPSCASHRRRARAPQVP